MELTLRQSGHVLEENLLLKREREVLLHKLKRAEAEHRKWEQIAVQYHDAIWELLIAYEPEKYSGFGPKERKG